jgi:hypothetical protein
MGTIRKNNEAKRKERARSVQAQPQQIKASRLENPTGSPNQVLT